MDKAEEFAYSKYPKSKKGVLYDLARNSIIQGYHQAEKDLELTWEDMKLIWNITDELENMPEEEFYKEVLKRFTDLKK